MWCDVVAIIILLLLFYYDDDGFFFFFLLFSSSLLLLFLISLIILILIERLRVGQGLQVRLLPFILHVVPKTKTETARAVVPFVSIPHGIFSIRFVGG